MPSTLIILLSLRSRRLTRFTAAAFTLVYAAFASGAAFGPLDLMGLPPGSAAKSPDCAKRCCGCGDESHTSGQCCCSGHDHAKTTVPASGISWLAAAKCSGAAETLAGEMTRVLPHVSPPAAESVALLSVEAPETPVPDLVSVASAPPEKVPLAL